MKFIINGRTYNTISVPNCNSLAETYYELGQLKEVIHKGEVEIIREGRHAIVFRVHNEAGKTAKDNLVDSLEIIFDESHTTKI